MALIDYSCYTPEIEVIDDNFGPLQCDELHCVQLSDAPAVSCIVKLYHEISSTDSGSTPVAIRGASNHTNIKYFYTNDAGVAY